MLIAEITFILLNSISRTAQFLPEELTSRLYSMIDIIGAELGVVLFRTSSGPSGNINIKISGSFHQAINPQSVSRVSLHITSVV